jgi:RNA polymerase sigma factor (sigma-70 family)
LDDRFEPVQGERGGVIGRRRSPTQGERLGRDEDGGRATDAARKRAAVEIVARHEATLRRTARRYSIDADDAQDAYQRALEILLTKAPTTDPRELIRWTQTVTKHEALAVRESRERLLGYPRRTDDEDADADPLARIAIGSAGPQEQVERREELARSREALRTLKAAELRALTLLAQGYSYVEIGEITGYSATKVNRVLAEGRERFRRLVASSEDGTRCRQLQPLLSAFCDGEANAAETRTVREHLRACASCRATMRAYRSAPRLAAAPLASLPAARSLLGWFQDLLSRLGARLPGAGNHSTGQAVAAGGAGPVGQAVAAGGTGLAGQAVAAGGGGLVTGAKLLVLCVGAGGAAGVATGVAPSPLDLQRREAPTIVRSLDLERAGAGEGRGTAEGGEGAPAGTLPAPEPPRHRHTDNASPPPPAEEASALPETPEPVGHEAPAAPVQPPPAPVAAAPAAAGAEPPGDSAAGEFGP